MAEQISDAKIKATEKEHSESFDSIFVNDGDKVRQVTKEKARELMGVTGAETAIEKLGEDSAETKRKLDFLWKLNQGISYQYETDSVSAYKKDIPSGAKCATVNKVGGKTVVWNQLYNYNTQYTSTSDGVTFTNNEDGSWTVNGTSTSKQSKNIMTFANTAISGHKYLIRSNIANSSDFGIYPNGYVSDFVGKKAYIISYAFNPIIFIQEGYTADNIKIIPQIFDLTQMFGAGNEPSTVAEFEAMFPADYYEYNAGTLMSAPVNEVVEHGKNLLDLTNVVSFTGGINYKCIPNKLKNNTKYTFSVMNQNNYTGKFALYTDTNGESSLSTGEGVRLSAYVSIGSSNTFTTPENVEDFPYLALCGSDATCGVQYFDEYDFQIEKGESATPYSPYRKTAYPIPQAITQLDGYGWGITDDVCNYVDLENKTYHKRIGSVDLGTLEWKSQGTGTSDKYCYYANLPKSANGSGGTYMPNCICVKYVKGTNNQTYSNVECISPVSDIVKVYDDKYADSNDASAFKEAMSGVMLYYELADEVVTDISGIIGDTFQNPFEVEPGGTLTFKNSNGEYYRIPVPNEEEYIISLAEVIA